MIQANELRIGNWVIYHSDEDMFTAIDGTDIVTMESKIEYAEKHSPIPLTPEILEKCGFENKSKTTDYYFESNYCAIILGGSMKKLYPSVYGEFGLEPYGEEIKSLHQLQNLYFALTGEELNIQL